MRPKLGRIFSIFQEVHYIRIIREKDPSIAIKASVPIKKKQGESVLPKQRALKLARDQFTKKIQEFAQPGNIEQQDTPTSSYAVDSTQQAAQFMGGKAVGTVKGSTQKAKVAIQQRQNFIKERKVQAAEKKAQAVDSVHRGQDIAGAGVQRGFPEQSAPMDIRTAVYHSEPHVCAEINYTPSSPQSKVPVLTSVQQTGSKSVSVQSAITENSALKAEPTFQSVPTNNSSLRKNQSINQSVQPPVREAGRSSIKEHYSGAIAPKEKPVRGSSAIKSRRAEETVKNLTNPIKSDMINTSRAAVLSKPSNPLKPGKRMIPRSSAGKALMERAARKMKLHSQKQLAQRAGRPPKLPVLSRKKLLPLRFGQHAPW